jgi:thiosulfate dehydrogenase [quinone] large subunit
MSIIHRKARQAPVRLEPDTGSVDVESAPLSRRARQGLAVLRIAYGLTFLWAFFDKLFGLEYDTPRGSAWIDGTDPTEGYLLGAPDGWLESFYHDIAGDWWVAPLFMLGLLGIGIALTLGIGMRIAAVGGALLYLMMWSVVLPPVNNPILDEHLLGAIAVVVLPLTNAGNTWGLGRQWARLPLVNRWRTVLS